MENKKQKKENKAKEQNKRQKNKINLGKQEAKEQNFSWKTGDKRTKFLLENKRQKNKISLGKQEANKQNFSWKKRSQRTKFSFTLVTFSRQEKLQRSGVHKSPRDWRLSASWGSNYEGSSETSRTSHHYRIDGLKGALQLFPHYINFVGLDVNFVAVILFTPPRAY